MLSCACDADLSAAECWLAPSSYTETGTWHHGLSMKRGEQEEIAMSFNLDRGHFGGFQHPTIKYPQGVGTVIIT